MNTLEHGTMTQENALPDISAQPLLCALSDRYASRGIVKAVQKDAAEQREKEEKNRELAPEAYRLSLLTDEVVKARYCHGEDADMTASDLVSYFDETRAIRLQNTDFAESVQEEESEPEVCSEETSVSERTNALPQKAEKGAVGLWNRFVKKVPRWIDTGSVDTSKEKKTFPLSAFATVAAIAASLMLIVASSVMVTLAESRVDALQGEIDTVVAEVADLNADLNVQHDLLQIREIAMREYGMVSEEYVRMDYVSLAKEDRVERFRDEEQESLGLSALLSAIGAQKKN